jgi:choline dehydrogenase-like flavoprotein
MTLDSFDYVVVGGGTAGLVVAARLIEDPTIRVCVLEAGEDITKNANSKIPGLRPPPLFHRITLIARGSQVSG